MKEENIVIFDPEGISPEKYKKAYPEFSRISEFGSIPSKELMVVWYFANPASQIVFNYPEDKSARMKKSLEKVYGKGWTKYEAYCKSIPQRFASAADRMSRIRPDARYKGKLMVDKIFKDYEDILKLDLKNFKKTDDTIDYNSYISTRKNILKELEGLIDIKEKGFSVKVRTVDRKSGDEAIEDFLTIERDRS